MSIPRPGMDPDLERPSLWEGVHTRLVVAIADWFQPLFDPRSIASVEERVFLEGGRLRYSVRPAAFGRSTALGDRLLDRLETAESGPRIVTI